MTAAFPQGRLNALMSHFFRNAPIQRKLTLIILVSCAAALLVAAVVEAGFRLWTERDDFRRDISRLARMIAFNSTAAVVFQDEKAVLGVLAALREDPNIRSATIWLPDGRVFCRYGETDEMLQARTRTRAPHSTYDGLMLRHYEPLMLNGRQLGTLYLRADFGPELAHAARYDAVILLAVICLSALTALLVAKRLQRTISAPIRRLAETAATIATEKDYSLRVKKFASDEVGAFTDVFNYMLGEIEHHDGALRREISERTRAEQELDKLHQQVLSASRQAGMAEVATGVLHNVGNVLNSVNISTALLNEQLDKSRAANVTRLANLLRSRAGDLGDFLMNDPKGRALPEYVAELGQRLDAERTKMRGELHGLAANIEHIKEIVAMQQNYARVSGETESLPVTGLIEDALKMNAVAFARHGVKLERDFAAVPHVSVDKHKVLQILTNLFHNAKYAVDGTIEKKKCIRVTTRVAARGFVAISVADNGTGIAPENLIRIFAHGFTTRKDGHGFGLHSGALAAKEMGGELTAQSDGEGRGATFTLTVPIAHDLVVSPGTQVCPPPLAQLITAS